MPFTFWEVKLESSILVFVSHPDDEVLGCGGTIARHTNERDNVYLLILSTGLSSRNSQTTSDQYSKLFLSTQSSSKILGITEFKILKYPDNSLDTIPRLRVIQSIESIISQISPITIYTHHYGDVNIDHLITCESLLTAARPMPNSCVKNIYSFEVPSSTNYQFLPDSSRAFRPNHYVDVSDYLNLKLLALKEYESEMRCWPHPRSYKYLEYLTHLRGSDVGIDASEAFMTLFSVR